MTFDDILKEIGQFGSYQKRIYALLCVPALCLSALMVVNVFLLGIPEHRCKIPGLDNDTYKVQNEFHQFLINQTIPAGTEDHVYDQCHVIITEGRSKATKQKCTEWVYDTTVYKNTFAKQHNLVCDDTLKTSHAQTVFFSGVLLGSIAFGQVSDIIGRRKTLYVTLWLLLTSATALAFAPEFISFCVLIFLVGAGNLGLYMTIYVLGMELVGPSKRKWTGNIIQVVLTVGNLYLALVVWLIRDWKYFELALSLPLIVCLPYYWVIPESCRWLLSRDRKEEVIEILKKAAKINKTHFFEKSVEQIPPALKQGRVWQLFSSKVLAKRTLVLYFNWFVCSMSYYGTVLNIGNLAGDLYLNFVLMVLVEFPAKAVAIYFLDKIGRKKLHIAFMIIGGIASTGTIFPILYGNGSLNPLLITLALIGKSCITGAFGTVYVLSAETYPTVVRNAGMGSSSAVARVGSMLSPYIAKTAVLVPGKTGQAIPLTLFGIAMFAAGLLTMTLPETLRRKMPDTIEDAENFAKQEKTEKAAEIPIDSEKKGDLFVTNGEIQSERL